MNDAMLSRSKAEINYGNVQLLPNGRHFYDSSIGNKTYRFCTEIIRSSGLFGNKVEFIRCAYSTESGRFRDEHECDFKIILPSDFKPPPYFDPGLKNFGVKHIKNIVADLVIAINLSINSANSKEMKTFISSILKIGFNIGKTGIYKSPEELPDIEYTRESLRKIIIGKKDDI